MSKRFLKSSCPSLLIKRAALGNLKASFHCTHWHRFFPLKKVFFRIPPSPFPKGAPPLISVFSPQARRRKPPSGARNRYALRLADQSGLRHIVRDGTAWLLWGSACNYIVESECMEEAYRLRPPFLFLIAVSLCTCRHSNEEYYFLFYF